jgi:glucokinase
MTAPLIVAGDIGGTKTVLALFQHSGGRLQQVRDARFASTEHPTFEAVLDEFLGADRTRSVHAGCFGVAGPVIGGSVHVTNLPWVLDEHVLARHINVPRMKLLNDLEAAAYGALFLSPDEIASLNPGAPAPRKGNVAIIAAGTGLGEAILYWDQTHYHPIASEGGHADFAPRTDEEIALLQHLRTQFADHVSYERVLSGPGLFNVYGFLRASGDIPEPAWVTEKLRAGDPSAAISEIGLAGTDPVCVKALDLFCRVYGAEAGNLALKCVALGGVFVSGGIAPKILPVLQNGGFMRAFTAKGRLAALLESLAVGVVLNPRTPLLGAAHYALRL